MDTIRVAYLSNNTIHVVMLSLDEPTVHEESAWALPRDTYHSFAALSCGGKGIVLLHASEVSLAFPSGARAYIVAANLAAKTIARFPALTEISLTWPKLSPDGKWIAATGIADGRDVLALVSQESGETEIFKGRGNVSAHSWSSAGDKLYLTTLDESGQQWEIAEFNRAEKTFKRICAGGRPLISRTGLLAFISSDRRTMSVVNDIERTATNFHGFFKDPLEWIDETKVLCTVSAAPYVDELEVADVRSGETHTRTLPSRGEISGACLLR